MQQKFEVEIASTPLTLKTANDEAVVNEIVKQVDEKVQSALKNSRTGSLQSAALIAALNIAEELYLLKKTARSEIERLGRQAEEILSDLETQVAQPKDH